MHVGKHSVSGNRLVHTCKGERVSVSVFSLLFVQCQALHGLILLIMTISSGRIGIDLQ